MWTCELHFLSVGSFHVCTQHLRGAAVRGPVCRYATWIISHTQLHVRPLPLTIPWINQLKFHVYHAIHSDVIPPWCIVPCSCYLFRNINKQASPFSLIKWYRFISIFSRIQKGFQDYTFIFNSYLSDMQYLYIKALMIDYADKFAIVATSSSATKSSSLLMGNGASR